MQLVHVPIELGIRDHVDDPAVLHHVVPIRDGSREAEILLDEQDRETLLLQLADRAADLLHDDRRESFGRLVQQQEPRAGAQDAADCEHLLFAARQFRSLALAPLGQIREQRVDLFDGKAAVAHFRRQHEIFLDIQARENASFLRTPRNAQPGDPVRRQARSLLLFEDDRALAPRHDAHDRLQRRRLAGAVASEQRGHFARRHVERDAVQDVRLTIPRLQVAHGEQRALRRHAALLRQCASHVRRPCTPR